MIKDIIGKNNSVTPGSNELEILREHFPACFKEDGSFDIVRFQEYLKDKVEVTDEGYELRFLGKNYARMLASLDTTTVIVPDEAHNSLPENKESKNIYISGDNLDALKHLLKSYAGQIKCIYIDPPYNTGSDGFVYNDNFNFTAEELSTKLSISLDKAQRVLGLTRRGSASHSAWLMFMLPRLLLARDLLSKDGVIFISIDDNEQSNLKLLCDDIFGEENLICIFCKKGTGGKQDSSHFAKIHEYVICYSRKEFIAGEDEKNDDDYPLTDEHGRKYKRQLLRKWGDSATRRDRPNMFFPLFYDGTRCYLQSSGAANIQILPMLSDSVEGRWRWGKDTMQDALDKNLVEIVEIDDKYIAYEKIYEPSEDSPATKLFSSWIDDVNNKTGKALLKKLFGGISPFEYPKPLDLIKRIIKMGNAMDGIILDFFSGSATTAHAVMEMNAEDEDHRKFILVQLPEPVKKDSPAEVLGYKYIDEIGIERIKKAAVDIKTRFKDTKADLGFLHFTLKEPSGTALDKIIRFDKNAAFGESTLMDEFGVPTILTTWLERDGYGLTSDYHSLDLGGYTAYFIEKHLYLINPDLTDDAVAILLDKYQTEASFNPQNVVIYGYSFGWNELQSLKDSLQTVQAGEKNLRINFEIRY